MYTPGRPSGQGNCVKKEPLDIDCENTLLSYHTPYTQVKHEPTECSGSSLLQDEIYLETKATSEAIPSCEDHAHFVRDYNSGSSLSEFKLQNKAYPKLFLDHFLSPQHSNDVQVDNTHAMYKWRKGRKGPRKVPRFIHEIAEQTRELVERRLRHCGDSQLYSDHIPDLPQCDPSKESPHTVKYKLAQKLDDKSQRKVPRQEDLPYMGQITLQGRPRRGRKPKKADICHLISKNYGISFDQATVPQQSYPRLAPTHAEQTEPLNLCTKDRGEGEPMQCNSSDSFDGIAWPKPHFLASPASPLTTSVSTEVLNKSIEAAKLMNIENCLIPSPGVPHASPTPAQSPQVSICKFKFTGGPRPSLERKRMLSVDSIGNFRLYSNIKNDCPDPSSSGSTSSNARSTNPAPSSRVTNRAQDKRRRKSRKSLMREKLEKTFKEKGFLIQTQQFEAPQGATFCKFRQLRKFTRYLFRSWKDYLPNNINTKTQPVQPTHSDTNK